MNVDFLIIRDDTIRLYSVPIGQCKQLSLNIKKYFNKIPSGNTYTYWTLEDNRLYLVEIADSNDKNNTADLSLIFGDEYKFGRVFAYWVSGELIHPQGKIIDFPGISTTEREIVFHFTNGSFTNKYEYDNSKSYRSSSTQNFDSLLAFLYSNIKWDELPKIVGRQNRVTLKIVTGGEKTEFQISILRGINSVYNNETLRVAKLITGWDVLYVHGQPEHMTWLLSIDFTDEKKNLYTKITK